MKPNLSHLTNEELRRQLHIENYKFNQGLDQGLSFNTLKEIRQTIRAITAELEARSLVANFNASNN